MMFQCFDSRVLVSDCCDSQVFSSVSQVGVFACMDLPVYTVKFGPLMMLNLETE